MLSVLELPVIPTNGIIEKEKERKRKERKGRERKERRGEEKKFYCTLMGTFIAVLLFSNIS